MEKFVKYAKRLEGFYYEYLPAEWDPGNAESILLQVTLGVMDLEDAFHVSLPSTHARLSVGELFNAVLGDSEPDKTAMRQSLDRKANPDLPDMYDALVEVFRDWNSGRCSLRLYVNNGPEMDLSQQVSRYLRMRRSVSGRDPDLAVLDVVIEQRPRALAYAVDKGYTDSRQQLLHWLQEHTLLYVIAEHGHVLAAQPASRADSRLPPVGRPLGEEGLLEISPTPETFTVTAGGAGVAGGMVAEAESYMETYDVFQDVLYDEGSGLVVFDTGRGKDLRVQVYKAEGLDPVRTVFLLTLYASTPDGLLSGWGESGSEEEFFEELLAPVVEDHTVTDSLMELIIESGFAHQEEQQEESLRLAGRRELLARARKD